jgi:tetratricopeptide (TPR) repeat protein
MTGQQRGRTLLICAALAALVFVVFGPALHNGFVNYDDEVYVTKSPVVMAGLNLKGLKWIFTHADASLYHPLTMLSLMVDYQLHGAQPKWFHLTNIILHGASAILLFLIFLRMTGETWACAFLAAIFAVHPLRVESVAWVAERKDVLGTFFFMVTLAAYVWYAAKSRSVGRYLLVVAAFAAALLSKPTVVTMPFVLLLLDCWPLRRKESIKRLAVEKLPLLAMGAAACALTVLSAHEGLSARAHVPLAPRLANAVVAYGVYLRQTVWPANLAPFYPQPPGGYSALTAAISLLLLTAITAGAAVNRKTRPWLLIGWLWYLGMLVPMIGLVQAGSFAHADRMTYLPQIGICLMAVWGGLEFIPRQILIFGGIVSVAALALCARVQTSYWHDSEKLWRHAIACTPDNVTARNNLGLALLDQGRLDEAISNFRRALEIDPDYFLSINNLGLALCQKGRVADAIPYFERALKIKPEYAEAVNNIGLAEFQLGRVDRAIDQYHAALRINPDYAESHNNLGNALLKRGQTQEALDEFETALRLMPLNAQAENNLGTVLRQTGRLDDAVTHYRRAAALMPDNESVHFNLARALLQTGNATEAINEYQRALQLQPNDAEAENNLAWILATSRVDSLRDGRKAVELARQANDLTGGKNPIALGTLAAALAENNDFDDATKVAHDAVMLAQTSGQSALAKNLSVQFQSYQEKHPLRQ